MLMKSAVCSDTLAAFYSYGFLTQFEFSNITCKHLTPVMLCLRL